MKTPREILLERHCSAGSRLDAIRSQALATLVPATGPKPLRRGPIGLLEFFSEYRWHFAGMAALWTVVAVLNLSAGRPLGPVAAIPREKIPSPLAILASLRENRRELWEMIQPLESRDGRPPKLFSPRPRSERHYEIEAA